MCVVCCLFVCVAVVIVCCNVVLFFSLFCFLFSLLSPLSQNKTHALMLQATFPISATLSLRSKTISKYTAGVRIVPVFDAKKSYDVLLVTCNQINQSEFQGWDYMFQLAGLAYSPWDLHRYKRLTAAPDLSWVGRTCFLVIPSFEGTCTARELINQVRKIFFFPLFSTPCLFFIFIFDGNFSTLQI